MREQVAITVRFMGVSEGLFQRYSNRVFFQVGNQQW